MLFFLQILFNCVMKLEIYKNIYHKKLKTHQLFYCLDLFDLVYF